MGTWEEYKQMHRAPLSDANAGQHAIDEAIEQALASMGEPPSLDEVESLMRGDAENGGAESEATVAALCARYPFLIPRNRFTGLPLFNPFEPSGGDGDGHRFTELSEMPCGWLKAFGIDLVEDVRTLVLAAKPDGFEDWQALETFTIEQIKEKFGELRLYFSGPVLDDRYANADRGGWNEAHDLITDLIELYSAISERCCIECGSYDDVRTTRGWISPECKECWAGYRGGAFNGAFESDTDPLAPVGEPREFAMYTRYSKDSQETRSCYERLVPKGSAAETLLGLDEPLRVGAVFERMRAGRGQQGGE